MSELDEIAQVIIGYIKSGDRGGKSLGQTILDAGYRKVQVVDGVQMVPNGYFWKERALDAEAALRALHAAGWRADV